MYLSVTGQAPLSRYLAGHHYSFTLADGFDKTLADTLQQRMTGYKLILQAEGGSHDLSIYTRLQLVWLKFLQQRLGLTHFVGESGPASAVLFNKYLDTGDSTLLLYRSSFWKALYQYNSTLPPARRLHYTGLDFDYPRYYFKALKVLLPGRSIPDSVRDCDFTIRFNKALRQDLATHQQDYTTLLGSSYPDFEHIVMNKSTCHDTRKNRNPKMAARFLESHQRIGDSLYFGEFGIAHTVLNTDDLAAIIRHTEPFLDKVCVINLYCYRCSIPGEDISNWPLSQMEKDIQQYFLPLCQSDLTLFDLTEGGELTSSYRKIGQWLIIAKDQH